MRNIAKDKYLLQGVEWHGEPKQPKRLLWFLAFASVPFVVWGAAVVLK